MILDIASVSNSAYTSTSLNIQPIFINTEQSFKSHPKTHI